LTPGGEIAIPQDPCRPGEALAGFLRQGSAGSVFLAAGPTDSSQPFPVGDVQSFSGAVTATPEPNGFVLVLAAGLCAMALVRRRLSRRRWISV
jgi:hypothetical protein